MTLLRLLLRALRHRARLHSAGALASAVAVMTVVGALQIGASVRASLREHALARLGTIELAFVSPAPLRSGLAEELRAALPRAVVAGDLRFEGDARRPDRPGRVRVEICDARDLSIFFFDGKDRELLGRQAAINPALARALGAREGDEILLSLPTDPQAPAGTLFSRRAAGEAAVTIRATVQSILPEGGVSRLSLRADEPAPKICFLPAELLAGELRMRGKINRLLLAGAQAQDADAALRQLWRLEDAGVAMRADGDGWILTHREFLWPAGFGEEIEAAAEAEGWRVERASGFLANRIAAGGRAIPYSVALGAAPDLLARLGPPPREDGALLHRWAAENLGVKPGDRVSLAAFRFGAAGEIREVEREWTVLGLFEAETGDRLAPLLPEYAGLTDTAEMGDWKPPLPIDLKLIRPEDEAFWERHRTAPKIVLPLAAGESFWRPEGATTGPTLTALRLSAPGGIREEALRAALTRTMRAPAFRPVRAEALAGAAGSTDFAVLFLALGAFLLASAAALVSLLLRLAVEAGAEDAATLLALGFAPGTVRRLRLGEGAVPALLGGAAGIPLGFLYAAAILAFVSARWAQGPAPFELRLHPDAALLLPGLCGLAVPLLAVWLTVGREVLLRRVGRDCSRPPVRSLPSLALRNAGRRPGRSLLLGGLLAAAAFLLGMVALQRPLLHEPDAGNPASPTGGFAFELRTAVPVYADLGTEAGLREAAKPLPPPAALRGVRLYPLTESGGENAGCVNPNRPIEPRVVGAPAALLRRGGFSFASRLPGPASAWELLRETAADGAIPCFADADTAEWSLRLPLGGTLEVAGADGRPVRLRLAGLFRRSLFAGDLVVCADRFREHWREAGTRRALVELPEGAEEAAVADALREALAPCGPEIEPAGAILAASASVQALYLSAFATLGALGLGLGMFGLGAVAARLVLERRGELALLHAIGLTAGRLRLLLWLETGGLAAAGLAAGLLAAAAAGAPRLLRLGMLPELGPLALSLLLVLAVGAGAIAWALRSATNGQLAEGLKENG